MAIEIKLSKDENAPAGLTDNEEIIELTDEITVASKPGDEVIELVDEVVRSDSANPAGVVDWAVNDQPDDAPVSQMGSEKAGTSPSETASAAFPDGDIKIGDDIGDEMELDAGGQDDFVDSLGMDLETNSAISQLPEDNEPLPASPPAQGAMDAVSPDQIEAALERVIMRILPEKIDSILSAAIEKTLTREIDKIKTLLLESSSGDNM